MQVNTAVPSYPSAISCHNQLGADQHTPTLSALGKSSQDSCLHCSTKKDGIKNLPMKEIFFVFFFVM